MHSFSGAFILVTRARKSLQAYRLVDPDYFSEEPRDVEVHSRIGSYPEDGGIQ